jgi:hypothetical protein
MADHQRGRKGLLVEAAREADTKGLDDYLYRPK